MVPVRPVESSENAGLDLFVTLCILAENKPSWTLSTSALVTLKNVFPCQ